MAAKIISPMDTQITAYKKLLGDSRKLEDKKQLIKDAIEKLLDGATEYSGPYGKVKIISTTSRRTDFTKAAMILTPDVYEDIITEVPVRQLRVT